MAYWFGSSGIKGTEYIKIFPLRAWTFVNYYINWLESGLRDSSSPAWNQLREPANKFSVEEAAQALAVLRTPAGQNSVTRKVLNTLFIHETGHATGGLPDHFVEVAPSDDVRNCLMLNRSIYGLRRMVVLSALGQGDAELAFPYRAFCHFEADGFGCSKKLNVKDW